MARPHRELFPALSPLHTKKSSWSEIRISTLTQRFRKLISSPFLYITVYNFRLVSGPNSCQLWNIFVPGMQENACCNFPISFICSKMMWNLTIQFSIETQCFQLSFECCPVNDEDFDSFWYGCFLWHDQEYYFQRERLHLDWSWQIHFPSVNFRNHWRHMLLFSCINLIHTAAAVLYLSNSYNEQCLTRTSSLVTLYRLSCFNKYCTIRNTEHLYAGYRLVWRQFKWNCEYSNTG